MDYSISKREPTTLAVIIHDLGRLGYPRCIVQAPLVGEDAQTWVSRTRQAGEQQREQQWRRELYVTLER